MSNRNRNWMYERLDDRGHVSHVFINGVKTLIEFASTKQSYMDGDKIKCPCTKCNNKAYEAFDEAKYHLYKFGFVPNYGFWDKHGETSLDSISLGMNDTYTNLNEHHDPTYREMVMDAAGPDFMTRTLDEEANPEDKKFFDTLEAADRELWPGCKKATQLSVVARLLNIKSEYRIPELCFDAICQLIKDGLPEENNIVDSLYESKKLIQALGLPVELIDCCRSGFDKAKKIHDGFMERCDRLEAIGEEIDEDKIFYDVVGGHDRKKRLYGFGSYGKHIRSSKGSSEMHREQYEDNNAETKVKIENLKKLVETQREQYEDIQQKYEDVQQKYEDAQKKNVEFQQKNVDVQAKFEQQLAQAMNVINTLSEQVKTFIK
ncbi:unnamed protein product [Lactuca saligna]|uniref:Transposase-associated domain-containing protein n=1 Tax=Lactuca saligna TaxID=75948 RepID=A0AA35ZRI6_LACSI|nr:unnamed protein product [Lactuca saligna]